jgi:hypothetical protein
MDEQAIGARRRPGFLDAEGFHAADLHRLQTIAAPRIGRRDPIIFRHARDHLLAKIVLLEDEFDQMGAAGKDAEIEPVAAVAVQTRGIAGQVAQHDFSLCNAVLRQRHAA